jgi:ribosomal protein S18 acetylase RimI-like enzyme
MERCEQRLSALGARRVVLEVAVDNAAAIAFYTARGYARQRSLPHYYPDGTDAYSMSKALLKAS